MHAWTYRHPHVFANFGSAIVSVGRVSLCIPTPMATSISSVHTFIRPGVGPGNRMAEAAQDGAGHSRNRGLRRTQSLRAGLLKELPVASGCMLLVVNPILSRFTVRRNRLLAAFSWPRISSIFRVPHSTNYEKCRLKIEGASVCRMPCIIFHGGQMLK